MLWIGLRGCMVDDDDDDDDGANWEVWTFSFFL